MTSARIAVLTLLLAIASVPGTAPAEEEHVVLYLRGEGPVGSVEQALAFGGAAPDATSLDPAPPAGDVPKVSQTVSGNAANPDLYGNFLAAYWRGKVRGTISNVTATLWVQTARSSAPALQVSLFADGSSEPIARATTTGPEDAGPSEVTVEFEDVEVPIGSELLLQVLPATNRQVLVYYDAVSTPSNVSFDLMPLPALPPGAGILDDLGRIDLEPGGSCAPGDDLCERALAMKDDSHVVIAIIDTGINPYHVSYRRDGMDVHPSAYIDGYPADPAAIVTSGGTDSYAIARANDDGDVWSQVEPNTLYWFPGTNIIGGISISPTGQDRVYRSPLPGNPGAWDPRRVIDNNGHGTGASSVAAGGGARADNGEPFGSNPEALLVAVQGFGTEAVEWVRSQPWIDFMSGSYGDAYAVPAGGITGGNEHLHTRPFVLEDGRTACFSAGNGVSRTGLPPDRWSSIRPTSGPSWVVTVGAASPRNGQNYWWHNVPVDVISYGNHWPAANAFSIDGEQTFSGTSSATPITCGVFSSVLLEARRLLGDTVEGMGDGNPAVGAPVPGSPALHDGVLTREELRDIVFKTAESAPFDPGRFAADPGVMPTTEGSYVFQGYGLVNVASGARALAVLRGEAPLPERPDVDAWITAINAIRDVFFPPSG